MSDDKDDGASKKKPGKMNVFSKKLGPGQALSEVQDQLDLQAIELVRKHNLHYTRKGAEMLRLINLCGLEKVGTDEMIGRLLESKVIAKKAPHKVEEWKKAGQAFRLEHNPEQMPGVFAAVVQNVDDGDHKLVEAVKGLGLSYSPRYDAYDGKVNIESALAVLRGTGATLRVKIGRRGKGGESYVAFLEKGEVTKRAREILSGDSGTNEGQGKKTGIVGHPFGRLGSPSTETKG